MPPKATAAAAAPSTATARKKKQGSSIFSFKCGCKDAKAVSISHARSEGSVERASADSMSDLVPATHLSGRHLPPSVISARPETSSGGDTITFTTATTSATSRDDDEDLEEEDDSPSFSGLLCQLNELERRVAAWETHGGLSSSRWTIEGGRVGTEEEKEGRKLHRHSTCVAGYSKSRGKATEGLDEKGSGRQEEHRRQQHRRTQSEGHGGRVLGMVGDSVAVLKQTEDPLGDFRRSMLQMIVEKEILCGDELQELLSRFLALNSPSHHTLIIRAFADIWREVFSGYGRNLKGADLISRPPHALRHRLPAYGRNHHRH